MSPMQTMPIPSSHAERPLHVYDEARGVTLACPHCTADVPVADPVERYAYYESAACPTCGGRSWLELYAVEDWNCFRLVTEY